MRVPSGVSQALVAQKEKLCICVSDRHKKMVRVPAYEAVHVVNLLALRQGYEKPPLPRYVTEGEGASDQLPQAP